MAMTKKQQFNPQPLLMFSLAVFLCPIVTAGFQEPLDWETGLDEGMYNLQSEPTFSFLSNIHYELATGLQPLCTALSAPTSDFNKFL